MRSRAASFVLALIALLPATVAAQAPVAGSCMAYSPGSATELVEAADLVVGGTIEVQSGSTFIVPHQYLKGAVSAERIPLVAKSQPLCPPAELMAGQDVVVLLFVERGDVLWPDAGATFYISDGQADLAQAESGVSVREVELVAEIRHITGQQAEPAVSGSEGATIDWVGTVLPVAVAVAVVFAIGLVMMREWHRIDPT